MFYPDFFITPRVIWLDQSIPPLAEKVYSVIYWYSKLKDGYCHASNATIAKNIGRTNATSIANAISKLIDAGYIQAEYNDNNERIAIVPLVEYMVTPSSNDEGGVHQMMTRNKNNRKESKTIKKHRENIDRLYKGWLIEMVIGSGVWLRADADSRVSLLDGAKKKVSLTPKREQKLARALDNLEYSVCAKAIKKIGQSDFHKGKNDRKWKATLEWLFNTDEKVEEFANR
jgi:DNA-binding MarR family transcriptional regulator